MNKGLISNLLEEKFNDHGISFSENISINTGETEGIWNIIDTDSFQVKKEKDKLNIYPANFFILYSQQKEDGTPINPIPSLPISGRPWRNDLVYLDVWIKEVKGQKDADPKDPLMNPDDLKEETSVRHKLEWLVRVVEERTGYTPVPYHHYYNIARIKNTGKISQGNIEDLREKKSFNRLNVDVNGTLQIQDLEIVKNRWAYLDIRSSDQDTDAVIRLFDENDYWSIHNDDSEGNKLDIRFNNSSKLKIDTVGKVGILTVPLDTLDINGDLRVRGGHIKDAGGTSRITIVDNGNLDLKDAGGTSRITIVDNGNLELKEDGGTAALTIDTAGRVGILTTPSDALDVNGDLRVRGGDIKDAGGTSRITIVDNGKLDLKDAGGTSRITIVDNGNLELKEHGGTAALTIDTAGRVGILTTPSDALDVNGDLRVRGGDIKDAGGTSRITIEDNGKLELKKEDGNGVLIIDEAGKVGIGKKNPSSLLTVGFKNFKEDGVAITAGSNIITGTGTSFMSKLAKGDIITVIPPDGDLIGGYNTVTDITSDTSLTVDNTYADTHSGCKMLVYYSLLKVESAWGGRRFYISPDGRVGIGTDEPGDDFLDVRGRCYSSSGWEITNADYAEYFESANGTTIPVATSVILTNEGKIRAAKNGEVPIGIVTENSAVVGNSYKEWPQKYLRDKYGRLIMEKVKEEMKIPKKEKIIKERQKVEKKEVIEEVVHQEIIKENGKYIQSEKVEKITREVEVPIFEEVDLYDATGEKIIGKHHVPVMETYEEEVDVLDETGSPVLIGSEEFETVEQPKLNPEYDETKIYLPRRERPEWNCIGLLGQLPLRKGKAVAPTWIKIKDLSDDVELWLVK